MDYFNRALRFFGSNGNPYNIKKSKTHCDVMKNLQKYHNVKLRRDHQENRMLDRNNYKTSSESNIDRQSYTEKRNIQNPHHPHEIGKSNNNGSSLKSVRISCNKAEIIRTPTLFRSESSSYTTKSSTQSDYNRSRRYRTLSLNDVKKRLSRKRKVHSKRFGQPLQSAFSIKRQRANIDFTTNNSKQRKNTRKNREIVTLFMTSKKQNSYTLSPYKMVGSKLKANLHSSKMDSDMSFFQKVANKFCWKKSVCPVCLLVSDCLRARPNCKSKLCSQHSNRLCRRPSRDDSEYKHVSFTSDLPVKNSLSTDETSCCTSLAKRKYQKPLKEENNIQPRKKKLSPKCKEKKSSDYSRRLYLIPIKRGNDSTRLHRNNKDENIQVSVTSDTYAKNVSSRDKETLSVNRSIPLQLKGLGDEAIHISVTSNTEPKKYTENPGNNSKQLYELRNSNDEKGAKCFWDGDVIPVKNIPRLTYTKETSCGQLFELHKKPVDNENKPICVSTSPANSYVAQTNVHVSVNTSSLLKHAAEKGKNLVCKQVAKTKLCKDAAALTTCPYIDEALNTSSKQLNTYEFTNSSHSSSVSVRKSIAYCEKCLSKRKRNFGLLCPGRPFSERNDKRSKSHVSCECYMDKAINTSREQCKPCAKVRRDVGCCTNVKLCESPLLCQCIDQKTSITRKPIKISASRLSSQVEVIERDPETCSKCQRKKINPTKQIALRPYTQEKTPIYPGSNRPCKLENTPICPGSNRPCKLENSPICPGAKIIYKKKADKHYPLAIPVASNTVHDMNSILSFFTSHRDSHKQVLRQLLFAIVVMTWCPCIILLCLGWCFSLPFKPNHLLSSENRRHGFQGRNDPSLHVRKGPGSNRLLSLWYNFAQEMKHLSRSIVTTDRRRRNMVQNNKLLSSSRSPNRHHDKGRTWRREYTTYRASVKSSSIKSPRRKKQKSSDRNETFQTSDFNSTLNRKLSHSPDQKSSDIRLSKTHSKSAFLKPLSNFFICPQSNNPEARNIDALAYPIKVTENKQLRAHQCKYRTDKSCCKIVHRDIAEEEYLPVSQSIHYSHRCRPRMRNTKLVRSNDSEGNRRIKFNRSRSEPKRTPIFPTQTYMSSAPNKCTICNNEINSEQKYRRDIITQTPLDSGDFSKKKVQAVNIDIKSHTSPNGNTDLSKIMNIDNTRIYQEKSPIKLDKSPLTKTVSCKYDEWSADRVTKQIQFITRSNNSKEDSTKYAKPLNPTLNVCECTKQNIVCECIESDLCSYSDNITKSTNKNNLCECTKKNIICKCIKADLCGCSDEITKRKQCNTRVKISLQDTSKNYKSVNAKPNLCECTKENIVCECIKSDLCGCSDNITIPNTKNNLCECSKNNIICECVKSDICEGFDKITKCNMESNLCECISDSTKRYKSTRMCHSTNEIQPNKTSKRKLVKSVSCQYFIKASNGIMPKIQICQLPCKSPVRSTNRHNLSTGAAKFSKNLRKIKCKCTLHFGNKKVRRSASTRNKIIQPDFPRINVCTSKGSPLLLYPKPCPQQSFRYLRPQPCSPMQSSLSLKPCPNYPQSNLRAKQCTRLYKHYPCEPKPRPLQHKCPQNVLRCSRTKPKTRHCTRGTSIRTYPRKCKKKGYSLGPLGRRIKSITKRCFEYAQDKMDCIIRETKAADREAWKADVTSCESLYMTTLTDRQFFWVFKFFPKCYPSFIAFHKSCRRYGKCVIFCFALCFWSPFVMYCYLCVQSCRMCFPNC